VRQLVCGDETQPGVVRQQPGIVDGWGGQDGDLAGRKHGRETVRGVDVVAEGQVHDLARRVELGGEEPVCALRLAGFEQRQLAIDRSEVDPEMRGVQGAPAPGRIDLGNGAPGEQR